MYHHRRESLHSHKNRHVAKDGKLDGGAKSNVDRATLRVA